MKDKDNKIEHLAREVEGKSQEINKLQIEVDQVSELTANYERMKASN